MSFNGLFHLKNRDMKTNLRTEWPYIIMVALPFLYLAYIWPSLPETVPMHWNLRGEIDRWGNKMELLLLPFLLPFLSYLIMLGVPYVDPKQQLSKMGRKYNQIKFWMIFIMSVLAIYLIFAVQHENLINANLVFILTGTLIAILGNYFQTIKPNYFIGLKTPWTLENEEVWRKTHQLSGIIWMIGGVLIAVASFFWSEDKAYFLPFFLTVIGVLTLVPFIYSYLLFKQLKRNDAY